MIGTIHKDQIRLIAALSASMVAHLWIVDRLLSGDNTHRKSLALEKPSITIALIQSPARTQQKSIQQPVRSTNRVQKKNNSLPVNRKQAAPRQWQAKKNYKQPKQSVESPKEPHKLSNQKKGKATKQPREDKPAEGNTQPVTAQNDSIAAKPMPTKYVRCLHCPKPKYPQQAVKSRLEGDLQLVVQINGNGRVAGVELKVSSGNNAIDQAAIRAAQSSRFARIKGGARVPVTYSFLIKGSRKHQDNRHKKDAKSMLINEG